MTQDPTHASGLSPDQVAALEHRLADAAAEVAQVQAQLAQARVAAPSPPVAAPGAAAPPVPYAGTGPHVITIDGREVTPGSGGLTALLQQLTPATGVGAPVVVVNGQTVSGGRPVDLSAYLTPQVTQQIQTSLHELGLDQRLGAMFGHPGVPVAPAAPLSVVALAEPPRHVPLGYRLATFDLSGYELFALLMGLVGPIALWAFQPITIPAGLILAVLAILTFRLRRYRQRIGVLRWGKVATVTANQTLSEGTYYGGVTYQNMRKRHASGWDATTSWYSGPGYRNKVDFTVDGRPGTLTFQGLLYSDGVVLADPREPSRALCVSQFPYPVRPGPDGELTGELPGRMWAGILVTLVVEGGLVALTVLSVLRLWVDR